MNNKVKETTMKPDVKPELTPKLRFPEFRDAEGWEEKQIGNFLSESRLPGSKGNVAKKITVKLWGNGVFEKNEAVQGSINTQYFQRKSGQFIYSKLDFLNQAFGVIPLSLDNFESTADLPCFDIDDGLNSVFLLEYVMRKDFYERLGETADGSRKARRIHAETFLSFPIALPIPSEQQKIAECLTSVDELIAAQARKLDALKTHKKGLMQQLFPREGETLPRLRFPEFRGEPEWEAREISAFAKVTTGGKDTQNKVDSGRYPFFVRSQTVERINSYSHDGEAVLTSGDGVGVGKNYHYIKGKFDFHQRVYCISDFDECVSGLFFYMYFSEHFNERVMRMNAKNSVDSVRRSMITEMPVLLPSLLEQQRIADCLASLDDLIAAQSQKFDALKTHKKGLMQQLFPSPQEVEA
jgi:type I restriction enzyme S subunit